MSVVNQLRERRTQAMVTLVSLLYGITAVSSFAFFVGLEVVRILSNISLGLSTSGPFDAGTLIHAGVYDILLIEYLLFLIILFNAMLSALMIRTLDGGHEANAFVHFVALTAVVTSTLVGNVLAV